MYFHTLFPYLYYKGIYRENVYAINKRFLKCLFNKRKKERLSWHFIYDTIELLIDAYSESNNKCIQKVILHLATIYRTKNYAFSLMYVHDTDEAEGAKVVAATCQYLCDLHFEHFEQIPNPYGIYLAFDDLELRHTAMYEITVLLKTHIEKNMHLKQILNINL